VVAPDLKRYVTLAQPRQGHVTQASRIVAETIRQTVASWHHQLSPQKPLR
jgi:LysR family nitrogen assimilation transcriptional regulator